MPPVEYFRYPLKVYRSKSDRLFRVVDSGNRCIGRIPFTPRDSVTEDYARLATTTLARGLNLWYEAEVLNDQPPELTFHVELWGRTGEPPYETVAKCRNYTVAKGAFEGAIEEYPELHVAMRQRARVIKWRKPPKE